MGDRALLCSGFFQDDFKTSLYKASAERGFKAALDKHRINLELVGIHNGAWKQSYRKFRDNISNPAVRNVVAYYKPQLRWHAKVFILFKRNDPIFGIIGSSNMTRTAFGTDPEFNHECDVVLWPSRTGRIASLMKQAIDQVDDDYAIIKAPYSDKNNRGVSISDRLLRLEKQIKEKATDILK
jgi:phosphatidylserine/phosphatidylglycerophosphate/cardiolipin synthase-like enzyme